MSKNIKLVEEIPVYRVHVSLFDTLNDRRENWLHGSCLEPNDISIAYLTGLEDAGVEGALELKMQLRKGKLIIDKEPLK